VRPTYVRVRVTRHETHPPTWVYLCHLPTVNTTRFLGTVILHYIQRWRPPLFLFHVHVAQIALEGTRIVSFTLHNIVRTSRPNVRPVLAGYTTLYKGRAHTSFSPLLLSQKYAEWRLLVPVPALMYIRTLFLLVGTSPLRSLGAVL
jgi:hypothetical protein